MLRSWMTLHYAPSVQSRLMYFGGRRAVACWSLLGLLFVGVLGTTPVQAQEGDQDAVLRGFVRSEAGGKPLQGANVVLLRSGGQIESAIATDNEGFYQLAQIPPGRYRFQVSFIGFRTYRDTLRLESGARRTLTIELAEATQQMEEVTVEIGRAHV